MEELDVEKFIISKEDFKKYFNKNKYVDKDILMQFLMQRQRKVIKNEGKI